MKNNILLSKYKKQIVKVALLNIFAILIIQASALIPIAAMQKVIDDYVPNQNFKMIAVSLFIFCGIPVCISILNTVFQYFILILVRRISLNINTDCFEKLLHQPMRFFNETHSAELTQKCTQEANNFINHYVFTVPSLIAGFVLAAVIIVLICFHNVWIGIAQLLYLPLLILPIKFTKKPIENAASEIVNGNAKYKKEMQESLHSVRLIKAFNMQSEQIEKVRALQYNILKPFGKAAAVESFTGHFTTQILPWLFQGATFLFAAYLMMKNLLGIGALITVTGYTAKLYTSFNTLINLFVEKGRIQGETEALRTYLALKDEKTEEEKNKWQFSDNIYFNNVYFKYPDTDKFILSGFNLEIKKRQWIGIEGASGIGKSTIFELLLKFYSPTTGSITVDGQDIKFIERESLRQNITCMFQNPYIMDCTVRENILLANPNATEREFNYAIEICKLKKSLLDEEIGRKAGESGEGLSGGECKKIALAQAILRNTELLLLDEPISNIDEETQIDIREALWKLKQDRDITIISISHQPDFHKYADKIIRLN